MVSNRPRASIKVSRETRDRVKRLKRAGESYDELLQKMANQYDPAQAATRREN